MDALAIIVAVLLAGGALAVIGDLMRPFVHWVQPPQIKVKVTRQRLRQRKTKRPPQAAAGSALSAPCSRTMPDGLHAVRKLLEAQREADKNGN